MTGVNHATINKALVDLENFPTYAQAWQTMEVIDFASDAYKGERRALVDDAHDLIADLVVMHMREDDPEWEGLVQDRVDAARYVLRGRRAA